MAKKQTDLPGMENREIAELKSLAMEYAEVRDQRMKLTEQEVELKEGLLAEMKKHRKRKYQYGGVSVEIITEKEKVKVRIAKEEEPQVEQPETPAAA